MLKSKTQTRSQFKKDHLQLNEEIKFDDLLNQDEQCVSCKSSKYPLNASNLCSLCQLGKMSKTKSKKIKLSKVESGIFTKPKVDLKKSGNFPETKAKP